MAMLKSRTLVNKEILICISFLLLNTILLYNLIGGYMWNDRLRKILSDDKIELLKNSKVLILGIGGVGGGALEALARIGIGTIILVDKDKVDVTNLNRQIISLKNNIGKSKVLVAKERVLNINPDCNVICIEEFINLDNIDLLFKYEPDFIIDCCDTVTTKIELIRKCLVRSTRFISCMGTGNKFHPELLEITDIKNTSYDPLARIIRNKFKDEKKKIMVVYSKEKSVHIKDRTPGSTSMVPPVAGFMCASYVINSILEV